MGDIQLKSNTISSEIEKMSWEGVWKWLGKTRKDYITWQVRVLVKCICNNTDNLQRVDTLFIIRTNGNRIFENEKHPKQICRSVNTGL